MPEESEHQPEAEVPSEKKLLGKMVLESRVDTLWLLRKSSEMTGIWANFLTA